MTSSNVDSEMGHQESDGSTSLEATEMVIADEPANQQVVCSSCGEPNPPALSWCEACGHDLNEAPKPACTACGDEAVEDDGYCHSCGHRQPVARDHVVMNETTVVAVSDRGKRHHHNEDAVAIRRTGQSVAIVVCDGVSSTPGSAEVSAAAAEAAATFLGERLGSERPHATEGAEDGAEDTAAQSGAVDDDTMLAAVAAAQAATLEAAETAYADEHNPPSTTFVAAVARFDGEAEDGDDKMVDVSVAWLGDSRAYWVDDGAQLLTEDHEIASALTRWLGPDAGIFQPDVAHYRFPRSTPDQHNGGSSGTLVVCSDGLWRYFDTEIGEPIESLLERFRGSPGVDLAEALVGFANERGGHDNISVGLWPVTMPDAVSTIQEPGSQAADQSGELEQSPTLQQKVEEETEQ